MLDSAHLAAFGRVYRGNAAADGSVTWSNVTSAANGGSPGVTIFDAAAPTADLLCIEIEQADTITGIGLLISQAAVLTGTPAAEVYYRSASGWVTVPGVVTPSLVATGLVTVAFSALEGSAIVLTDDEIDRRNNPQHRCAFLRFTGITAATQALIASRVYKRLSHVGEHSAQDLTTLFAQGASPSFATRQAAIQPVADDLLLFGFDEIPLQLLATLYRSSGVPSAQREWIYSRAADFVVLPAASLDDPSTRLSATLPLAATTLQGINLTSTYTGTAWGSSGIASTETLAGDGYVEFAVGANPALALFVGLSESNANASYTSIGWAIHAGAGGISFASSWRNGVQQAGGTWAIAAGDVLRLTRTAGVLTVTQNGTLRHTFAATSTALLLIDAAFISAAAITNLVLVDQHTAVSVPGQITWQGNVAVTVANGGTASHSVAVPAVHRIALAPPADVAKQSVLGAGGTSHSRYWLGLRQTADAAAALPENVTMRAMIAKGAGASGVPADAAAYTQMVLTRHPAAGADAIMTIVNTETGQVASVTLPAGATVARATINLAGGAVGDEIVLLRSRGPEMDDSCVYLF